MNDDGQLHPTINRDVFTANGIDIRHLQPKDRVSLLVGIGNWEQHINMEIGDPWDRSVVVESLGENFRIEAHMTHFSGCIPYVPGTWVMNLQQGFMIPGAHPVFGAFVFAPIKKILINGQDASEYFFNRDSTG